MTKNEPLDKELYEKIKKEVWSEYKVPSANRSAQLVKRYKEAGGTYSGKKDKDDGIARWTRERWESDKGTQGYTHKNSVYRPTVRVTKDTPATFAELTPEELKRAKAMKARTGREDKFKNDIMRLN